jgi:hypothetical protein
MVSRHRFVSTRGATPKICNSGLCRIYPTIAQPSERTGGTVPETGDALARWIGDWLRETRRADNLRKLTRSGLPERHAFVIVTGFATAPLPVVDLLMRPAAPAPTIPPGWPCGTASASSSRPGASASASSSG